MPYNAPASVLGSLLFLAITVSWPISWAIIYQHMRQKASASNLKAHLVAAMLGVLTSFCLVLFSVVAGDAAGLVATVIFCTATIVTSCLVYGPPRPTPVVVSSASDPGENTKKASTSAICVAEVGTTTHVDSAIRVPEEPKDSLQIRVKSESNAIAGLAPVHHTASGSLCEIEFNYVNGSGESSHRVVEVRAVDNAYFEGFCHKAMATRTFAISRVVGDVVCRDTGEVLRARKWAARARTDVRNSGVLDFKPKERHVAYVPDDIGVEILFTGFKSSQRQELEDLAEAAGMIVRKSVTKGLSYLCTGPNAGPTKLAQAIDTGASIIELDEFLSILND